MAAERKRAPERRALADVLRPKPATMRNDDGTAYRKTQSCAVFLGSHEWLEDALEITGRDATPSVRDRHFDAAAVRATRANVQLKGARHRLHRFAGVHHQI